MTMKTEKPMCTVKIKYYYLLHMSTLGSGSLIFRLHVRIYVLNSLVYKVKISGSSL